MRQETQKHRRNLLSVAVINLDSDTGFLQSRLQLLDLLHMLGLVFGLRLGVQADRNNDCLDVGHLGRENEALVIAVDHDHNADDSGRETPVHVSEIQSVVQAPILNLPGVLPDVDVASLLVRVLNGNAKHFTEVLSESAAQGSMGQRSQPYGGGMRRISLRSGSLDSSSICRDESFHGRCPAGASKFLCLCLLAAHHRNRQQLLKDGSVELQDLKNLLRCELLGEVSGVPLLPQELAGAEEWGCLLGFPPDDTVPLVQAQGEVAMGANPLGVVWVHDGFGCGTHGDGDLLVVSFESGSNKADRWRVKSDLKVLVSSAKPSLAAGGTDADSHHHHDQ